MTEPQLPVRSINSALRASHERLTSDVLVPGDPDYPFPDEDFVSFVLLRLDNSWEREKERATWSVPETVEDDAAVACAHCGSDIPSGELAEHWSSECRARETTTQTSLGAWS